MMVIIARDNVDNLRGGRQAVHHTSLLLRILLFSFLVLSTMSALYGLRVGEFVKFRRNTRLRWLTAGCHMHCGTGVLSRWR